MTVEELSRDWSPERKQHLACALNLYTFAQLILSEKSGEVRRREKTGTEIAADPLENARRLCLMGGLAEKYRANLFWLQELLAVGNQIHASLSVAVAMWRRYYDCLIAKGVRPPIRLYDGTDERNLPFDAVHKTIMETLANVKTYRKSIKEGDEK